MDIIFNFGTVKPIRMEKGKYPIVARGTEIPYNKHNRNCVGLTFDKC
jgi:hypothetical protein